MILNGRAALLTYTASVYCHADGYSPACDVITRIHIAVFSRDEIKGGEVERWARFLSG